MARILCLKFYRLWLGQLCYRIFLRFGKLAKISTCRGSSLTPSVATLIASACHGMQGRSGSQQRRSKSAARHRIVAEGAPRGAQRGCGRSFKFTVQCCGHMLCSGCLDYASLHNSQPLQFVKKIENPENICCFVRLTKNNIKN